jgi:hypothetical protein
VIEAAARFQPSRKRQRQKSQYQLYPLPFFNRDACCPWEVSPTGDYTVDCKTGQRYAVDFLDSCDGTNGLGIAATKPRGTHRNRPKSSPGASTSVQLTPPVCSDGQMPRLISRAEFGPAQCSILKGSGNPRLTILGDSTDDPRPSGTGPVRSRSETSGGDSMQPLAFSVRAAGEAAGVGRSSLYEQIRVGELQARKRGRRTVILRKDLEAWLDRLPPVRRAQGAAPADPSVRVCQPQLQA